MILFDKKIRPRRQTPNGVRIIHTVPPESFTLLIQLSEESGTLPFRIGTFQRDLSQFLLC